MSRRSRVQQEQEKEEEEEQYVTGICHPVISKETLENFDMGSKTSVAVIS